MQNLKNNHTTGSCFPESGRLLRKILPIICVTFFLICVFSYSVQAADKPRTFYKETPTKIQPTVKAPERLRPTTKSPKQIIPLGSCCKEGQSSSSTKTECQRSRGVFFATEREAMLKCTGFCCDEGTVTKATQATCRKQGGIFLGKKQDAENRCAKDKGVCCAGGEIIESTVGTCKEEKGTFYRSERVAVQKCQGYCCDDFTVSKTTQQLCKKTRGKYFGNKQKADRFCKSQKGYCCIDGKIRQLTPRECTAKRGTLYNSKQIAAKECKNATGYCNQNGNTVRLTEDQCKKKKGNYFNTQNLAKRDILKQKRQQLTKKKSLKPQLTDPGSGNQETPAMMGPMNPRLPDLTVRAIDVSNKIPQIGTTVKVHATIFNVGSETASRVVVRFSYQGEHQTKTISRVDSRKSAEASVDITIQEPLGQQVVEVYINPNKIVRESDHGNNRQQKYILVRGSLRLPPKDKLTISGRKSPDTNTVLPQPKPQPKPQQQSSKEPDGKETFSPTIPFLPDTETTKTPLKSPVKAPSVTPNAQTTPLKPKLSTTPAKSASPTLGLLKSTRQDLSAPDPYCFNDLYGDMKRTFNQVSQMCTFPPNPSPQSYMSYRERMDFNFFNWNLSKCPSLVQESVNKDVHDINFLRMPQAAAQCMNKCYTVVNDLLIAGSFSAALSQCESCCGFSPEVNQSQCKVECNQAIDVATLTMEQMRAEAKAGAASAREAYELTLRVLKELAERQVQNAGTMTGP